MSDMEIDIKKVEENVEGNQDIDNNLKEIINRITKNKELTKEEIGRLTEETKGSIDFLKKIEEIEIEDELDRVIFTDGDKQLIYINGEFFLVSSTDNTKKKTKMKKAQAKDMYLEYFIKYQLNPILEQTKNKEAIKVISNDTPKKLKSDKLKDTLGKDVKEMPAKEKTTRTPRTKKKQIDDLTK